MTRRLTQLAALYLLLGLAATWAVAWGSALADDGSYADVRDLGAKDQPHRSFRTWQRFGVAHVVWYDFVGWADHPTMRGIMEIVDRAPRSLRFVSEWRPSDESAKVDFAVLQGWPAPALASWILQLNEPGDRKTAGAFVFPSTGPAANGFIGGVPLSYHPYWPGLLANTLFYALLLATFHQLTTHARRAHRRKRNRCPSCNYDLRGLTTPNCPECARPLSAAHHATDRTDHA